MRLGNLARAIFCMLGNRHTEGERSSMTLLELLGLLRKHLALVIALPVICAIVTAAVAWGFMANTYTASTSLYILTKTSTSTDSISNSDLSASQMLTNDVASLVKSDRIKTEAAKALGLSGLSGYSISVDSSTTTRVITLKVTGTDPDGAAQVANQIASTTDKIAQSVMDIQSVNVIDTATAPEKASGPNRIMYTGVAFLAGLFVAIAIVVLMDMINTRVRNEDEIAELTGLTVIGRVPAMKEGR